MTDLSKNIQALREKKAVVEMGGGEAAIEKQIAMGKLTARDRILSLLDKNSFHEYDLFVKHDGRDFGMDKKDLPGDGVVTGTGTIFGAPVCIYAQDFTVAGGSLGLQHARKITKIMDHALKMKCPIIGINDSGGARIQEGVGALAGYGLSQYNCFRCYSSDLVDLGTLCRWSCIFSGFNGLRICSREYLQDVYYRSECDQDRVGRRYFYGRPGWCTCPCGNNR